MVFPKLTNDETELTLNPEDGVTIITGLGRAGMALSFSLVKKLLRAN